jgi:nucleoside transporter
MNYIKIRLSVMMFLQFFIWGGWFVTLGTYLGANLQANGGQIGMAFSTQSWGAIVAPLIFGLIADKYFNAERILGVLHIVGAGLMYMMYLSSDFAAFYLFVLAYMIVYMPTLALVNSVCFRQMSEPSKEFGKIRVWGTVGWIAAGLMISYAFSWDDKQAIVDGSLRNTFALCAAVSLVLGLYSFTLPLTKPAGANAQNNSISQLLGLDALALLKDRNFLVFFISSILICIPLAFYYQNANPFLTEIGVDNATGKMTLGQISEVLFMLALPVFLNRFGIKITLLLGMLAWVLRYVLFAYGDAQSGMPLLIVGIALHGICYDFFFVSGQIYTNAKASQQSQSSAQGLITLATYGVGMLIGFWVAGKITDTYLVEGTHAWPDIWLFPAGFALVVLILFLLAFKSEDVSKKLSEQAQ